MSIQASFSRQIAPAGYYRSIKGDEFYVSARHRIWQVARASVNGQGVRTFEASNPQQLLCLPSNAIPCDVADCLDWTLPPDAIEDDANAEGWEATHEVSFVPSSGGEPEVWKVMVSDQDEWPRLGVAAFTASEWLYGHDASWCVVPAQYKRAEIDAWTFEGSGTPHGRPGMVSVRKLPSSGEVEATGAVQTLLRL